MKLKRVGIIFTIMLMIVVLAVSSYNFTYAESADDTMYLGIQLYRKSGDGYIIANSVDNTNAKKVWKIVSYNDTTQQNPNYDKNIFCLEAEKGFANFREDYYSKVEQYNYHKNMYDEQAKQEIINKWNSNKKTSTTIDDSTYNKILWIIDNMYVDTGDEETNKKLKEELYGKVEFDSGEPSIIPGKTLTLLDMIKQNGGSIYELNDDQIEIVQQLAIWYFTNKDNPVYYSEDQSFTLRKKKNNEENYEELSLYLKQSSLALYRYLINEADKQGNYTHQESESSLVKTTATFWADQNNANQPVVIVEKTPQKEFDLSLRKSITSIQKTDGTKVQLNVNRANADASNNIRNITINTSKLDNKTDDNKSDYTTTTAEYKHRKDPVTIDTGDLITYTITVYNEGSVDGRAKKIIDQLPTGLKFNQEETNNINKNSGYKFEYDETSNRITISEQTEQANLKAYTGNGSLSSKEIQLVCKVEQERQDQEIILTNIAWIAEDTNTSNLTDRDSQPTNIPNKSKDELKTTDVGYTGKDTHSREDLANADTYFKGQEDDDDFDKLVLPAKVKIFDLSLRKYITKVTSADGTVVTDIENSSSKRNPVVDTSTLKTGTTANYKHRKDPVIVNTGDLVTYNITVYNEGEKNGRATKIVDQLPVGLEFNKDETEKLTENSGYTFNYDEANNKVTISEKTNSEHKDLLAYSGTGELDSKTIQVVCNVTEEKETTEKILTYSVSITIT